MLIIYRVKKGRFEVRDTDQHDSYGDEISNLCYVSDKGEKILASYDHGYNFIDSDNEYLITSDKPVPGQTGQDILLSHNIRRVRLRRSYRIDRRIL